MAVTTRHLDVCLCPCFHSHITAFFSAARISKKTKKSAPRQTKATNAPQKRAPSVESEDSHITFDSDTEDAAEHGDDDEDGEEDDDDTGLSGMADAELHELMVMEVSRRCLVNASHVTALPGCQH